MLRILRSATSARFRGQAAWYCSRRCVAGGDGAHSQRQRHHSTVRENLEAAVPTPRLMNNTFPFSCARSTMVRKLNPGPPELESESVQVPELKSAVDPAHSSRLVPPVRLPNTILMTALAGPLTGIPVTRNLPVVPTVSVT